MLHRRAMLQPLAHRVAVASASSSSKAAAFVHSATPPFLCSLPHCLAHRTNRPMSVSVLDAGEPEPRRFGGAVSEREGRNL
jgi:hypothetical protein